MVGTKDISRGDPRKMTRLADKVACLMEERVKFDLEVLTICTVPFNMLLDQNGIDMNKRVNLLNDIIRGIHSNCCSLLSLMDIAAEMNISLPPNSSRDGIHFDHQPGEEWLNFRFQQHVDELKRNLIQNGRLFPGTSSNSPFLTVILVDSGRLESRSSRDRSDSSRTRKAHSSSSRGEDFRSPTPYSSVTVQPLNGTTRAERRAANEPREKVSSRSRYMEQLDKLHLHEVSSRQKLMEALERSDLSYEDLSCHYCVDWLKAHMFELWEITYGVQWVPTSTMSTNQYNECYTQHRQKIYIVKHWSPN